MNGTTEIKFSATVIILGGAIWYAIHQHLEHESIKNTVKDCVKRNIHNKPNIALDSLENDTFNALIQPSHNIQLTPKQAQDLASNAVDTIGNNINNGYPDGNDVMPFNPFDPNAVTRNLFPNPNVIPLPDPNPDPNNVVFTGTNQPYLNPTNYPTGQPNFDPKHPDSNRNGNVAFNGKKRNK